MGSAVEVGELRSGELGSGELGCGVEIGGVGVGGVGVGRLGPGELGLGSEESGLGSRIVTPTPPRPPPFSKLPTPTSFHTFCVKSSLRQMILASSRSRQVCSRQIVRVKLSCTQ